MFELGRFCVHSVLTFVSVAVMALTVLNAVGFDFTPLLTLGSISTVIAGFSSQQLLTNAIAGIMLVGWSM